MTKRPCGRRAWARRCRKSSAVEEGFSKEMRRTLTALFGLVFLFGGAGTSRAEVRRVQMRIGGYLCGN